MCVSHQLSVVLVSDICMISCDVREPQRSIGIADCSLNWGKPIKKLTKAVSTVVFGHAFLCTVISVVPAVNGIKYQALAWELPRQIIWHSRTRHQIFISYLFSVALFCSHTFTIIALSFHSHIIYYMFYICS